MNMLKIRGPVIVTVICLLATLGTSLAAREGQRGRSGYDPDAEMTISGKVEKVAEQECRKRNCRGVHLWLVTEAKTYEVHVGPAHFLEAESFELAQGDELRVIGAPVPGEDDALIAREIARDGETLTLRDERGLPEWRGSGHGRHQL